MHAILKLAFLDLALVACTSTYGPTFSSSFEDPSSPDDRSLLGSAEGVVTDENGSPIDGAVVSILEVGRSTRTDARGHYELLDLEPATYAIAVDAGACLESSRSGVEVLAGQVTTVDFALDRAASESLIHASFLTHDNLDGHPIANATLTVAPNGASATTDTTGATALCVAPGRLRIHVTASGYMDAWEPLDMPVEPSGTIEIVMAELDPPPTTQGFPPRAIPNTFCVNTHTHYLLPSEVDAVSDAGFRFHRLGMDQWLILRAPWNGYQDGRYVFGTEGDGPTSTVPAFLARGVRMLGIIEYDSERFGGPPRTSEQRAEWTDFASQAAEAFRGQQIIYELSNEPIYYTAGWDSSQDPAHYVAAAREVTQAVHAIDPAAIVCAPGGAFIDDYLLNGIADAVDCYSDHMYQTGPPEDAMGGYRHLREMLATYTTREKPIPIINSEQGWYWKSDGGDLNAGGEEMVGWYIARMYLIDLLNDVRMSCWYDWNHLAGYPPVEASPLVLQALKTLATELDGYRFLKRIPSAEGRRDFILVFQKDAQRRYAVWTVSEYAEIEIFIGADRAETVNWNGTGRDVRDAPGGRVRFGVGGDVQYIEPLE